MNLEQKMKVELSDLIDRTPIAASIFSEDSPENITKDLLMQKLKRLVKAKRLCQQVYDQMNSFQEEEIRAEVKKILAQM